MLSNSKKHLQVRGTEINYYFICKTKLWLFSHNIQMEQESESVSMGKQLHKKSYSREKKDFTIDNLISVDFLRRGETLELHGSGLRWPGAWGTLFTQTQNAKIRLF